MFRRFVQTIKASEEYLEAADECRERFVVEELGRLASAYRQHIVTRKYPLPPPTNPKTANPPIHTPSFASHLYLHLIKISK